MAHYHYLAKKISNLSLFYKYVRINYFLKLKFMKFKFFVKLEFQKLEFFQKNTLKNFENFLWNLSLWKTRFCQTQIPKQWQIPIYFRNNGRLQHNLRKGAIWLFLPVSSCSNNKQTINPHTLVLSIQNNYQTTIPKNLLRGPIVSGVLLKLYGLGLWPNDLIQGC